MVSHCGFHCKLFFKTELSGRVVVLTVLCSFLCHILILWFVYKPLPATTRLWEPLNPEALAQSLAHNVGLVRTAEGKQIALCSHHWHGSKDQGKCHSAWNYRQLSKGSYGETYRMNRISAGKGWSAFQAKPPLDGQRQEDKRTNIRENHGVQCGQKVPSLAGVAWDKARKVGMGQVALKKQGYRVLT